MQLVSKSKLSVWILACLALSYAKGQGDLRHQLTFTCDNNFFLFDGDDGYYTNGVFLRYDRLSAKSTEASFKRIFSYELGQMIFAAHSRKLLPVSNSLGLPYGVGEIDRPIAGYLYGKATQTTFYANRRMWAWGISVGTIGDNSFGKEAQEFWHTMIGVKSYWNWVWDYQVKNEVGANLHGAFAQSMIRSETSSLVQITPVTQIVVGTTFTNVTQSAVLQIGKLRAMSSSSYWNSRLSSTDNSAGGPSLEFFVYYKPSVRYQLYNATVQGGMLRSDKGPIIADVQPFVFSHEVGLRLSVPRYCVGYQLTFQSKEARGQFYRQSYASVYLSWRF